MVQQSVANWTAARLQRQTCMSKMAQEGVDMAKVQTVIVTMNMSMNVSMDKTMGINTKALK